jgi:hypothetical protein
MCVTHNKSYKKTIWPSKKITNMYRARVGWIKISLMCSANFYFFKTLHTPVIVRLALAEWHPMACTFCGLVPRFHQILMAHLV